MFLSGLLVGDNRNQLNLLNHRGNKNPGMSYGNLGPKRASGACKGPGLAIHSQCKQSVERTNTSFLGDRVRLIHAVTSGSGWGGGPISRGVLFECENSS